MALAEAARLLAITTPPPSSARARAVARRRRTRPDGSRRGSPRPRPLGRRRQLRDRRDDAPDRAAGSSPSGAVSGARPRSARPGRRLVRFLQRAQCGVQRRRPRRCSRGGFAVASRTAIASACSLSVGSTRSSDGACSRDPHRQLIQTMVVRSLRLEVERLVEVAEQGLAAYVEDVTGALLSMVRRSSSFEH